MLDIFQEARRLVSVCEVAELNGLHPNRGGFICCPLHHERTPSLKLFPDGGWKYFGCGKGGSVIGFTAELFNLTPLDAVRRLNHDFHLGLPLDRQQTPQERTETAKAFETWCGAMLNKLTPVFRMAHLALKDCQTLDDLTEAEAPPTRKATPAAAFGEADTRFLWHPYLPIGEYSVMMADGGTGKTILCCGIAAAVSTGSPLPGEYFPSEGKTVLIISAEDSGPMLKKRLALSGADLNRVFILDCSASVGLNFSDGYEEFSNTVVVHQPALVVIAPWHAFLGADIDINRVNAVRPVFQKLAHLAKKCQCAMILVSHVNKRAQGENANNAATGSTDFINASRSAFRVIFDDTDEDCRGWIFPENRVC